MRRQTYGYLPSHRALILSRYSYSIPLRVGGWVGPVVVCVQSSTVILSTSCTSQTSAWRWATWTRRPALHTGLWCRSRADEARCPWVRRRGGVITADSGPLRTASTVDVSSAFSLLLGPQYYSQHVLLHLSCLSPSLTFCTLMCGKGRRTPTGA